MPRSSLNHLFSPGGFTIIEALISITIIVLITSLALPNLRRFNDDQQLKLESEKLVSILRLAQSNAQNRIQPSASFSGCPSGQNLYWQVYFDPASRYYSLGWVCDSAGQAAVGAPAFRSVNADLTAGGITFDNLPANCHYLDFTQNQIGPDVCFNNGVMTFQLKSTKTSTPRTITVNQGGSISAQ